MNDSPFEQWYNGITGFHLNSERIVDDLYPVDPVRLRRWMIVCWNNAIEASQHRALDCCPGSSTGEYLSKNLEILKEKS